MAAQDIKPKRKYVKKERVYVIPDGARGGMLVLLEAIKAAHARARVRGRGDEVLRRMDLPRFRNGHYGMVKFLQRNDKNGFDPGDWYGNSYFNTEPGNLQAGFVELIAQLTKKDASDDDVNDKFYWKWWSV